MDFLLIGLASLLAGFIDAIVGGGGLILVPALFIAYPQAHAATLLGTNKSASIWGTAIAAWRYGRQVELKWSSLWPAAFCGFLGSLLGAWLVTFLSTDLLRKFLPVVLLAVLIYTIIKKDLGQSHTPRYAGRVELLAFCLLGTLIGVYDGFFGPGTGSFLVFLMVRWLGFDFINASGSAKVINVATNLAALLLFSSKGYVWWHLTFIMAGANILGSLLGSYAALRFGTGFVRYVFILVVATMTCKVGFDAYFK